MVEQRFKPRPSWCQCLVLSTLLCHPAPRLYREGVQMTPRAAEFKHQGYSEKETSNERVANWIPVCLSLSRSSIPKSKNSSLYWNSFPYEFIPIQKRITGSFLEEANSISALKIRLKLPNVISYAIPSPHPQPQHTSHC